MKLMSFSLTKDAFLRGEKTVTRRLRWESLRVATSSKLSRRSIWASAFVTRIEFRRA